MSDRILISALRLETHLGVPDAERANPQFVEVTVELEVRGTAAAAARDDIALTVNYGDVARTLARVAAHRPRKLLETLAEDLAAEALRFEGVRAVKLVAEKFVLPNAQSVAVRIRRKRKK
ncbi:MAG: dihydroneopterin aldolase [Verrucomicrobium sp.]|nr:dihydroneopterin aldolase [Verrucomicrobium sp.]